MTHDFKVEDHVERQAFADSSRPLHYLAIPPSLFATVADGLANSGCGKDARVVVEKLLKKRWRGPPILFSSQ